MEALNEIIHQQTRLRILAALVGLDDDEMIEFPRIAKSLRLTDGNVGAHLLKLEEFGYIKVEKSFVDRKPKTMIGITLRGRVAFAEYVAALRELLAESKKLSFARETKSTNVAAPAETAKSSGEKFSAPESDPDFLD